MIGIDIGCYLEDKSREFRFCRLNHTLFGLGWLWTRSYINKTVQQFLDTKVIQSRAKENRCYLGITVGFFVKSRIYAIDQFKVVAQLLCFTSSYFLFKFTRCNINCCFLCYTLLVWREEIKLLLINIIYTLETLTLTDGP